jgi:hypothetical protein
VDGVGVDAVTAIDPRLAQDTPIRNRNVKPSREYALRVLIELLQMAIVVAGLFLMVSLLVILGIATHLWLEEPKRLAYVRQVSLTETNLVLIEPQPLQVSSVEANVVLIKPPIEANLSGAATNAAIWVDGKAFHSGGPAAWESVRSAWRLWLLSAGALICHLLLGRYGSAVKTRSELRINTKGLDPGI